MTSAQASFKKHIIQTNQPFTETLAEYILSEHKDSLPDLSNVCIFIPNAQATQQLRYSLSKVSPQALIGVFIGNLSLWLNENISPARQIKKQINQSTRQLLLLEALKQYPELFPVESHWQVCDSLLELFDELSLSPHQWLNESTPVWIKYLKEAYQADQDIDHLNQEARIIQTLWQAWQQQLSAMQVDDEASTIKHRLLSPVPDDFKNTHFYIIGLEQFSPMERAWCEQLSKIARVTWITQGEIPQDTAKEKSPVNNSENHDLQLLKDIYSKTTTFFERTKQYNNNHKNNFLKNIKLFDAQSAEQETQSVDLKVRLSLLAGKNNIGVVTENRKIARRLRALLERADVNIQDTAGWALATTSAASVLERWLECIEQDYAYQPLLDLLKSPFFCEEDIFNEHLNLVYRFEQDIILHENIANDLQRYRAAIKNRSDRINLNTTSTAEQLLKLLDNIEQAGSKFISLYQNNKNISPDTWINTFIESIEKLGIYQQLSNDIAGLRIQQELEKLSFAHITAKPDMSWQDFRTWLGSTLEREQFKPHDQISAVKIMNMQQAQYCQFDTLIIAGANMQSLPGAASQLPFFNQSVRQHLQLKNWHQKKEYSFYQFQQLLLSSDDILITWQAEKNGEWMQPSPWVSSLQDFSEQAFNQSLHDYPLDNLLNNINPVTERSEDLIKDIQTVSQAFPSISKENTPTTFQHLDTNVL